ncbi:hypothetical protein GGI20_001058 [Coemansia sp. BCRC 34301]|nr:hypothetical protein GGI20_001058 [Coemansia sp. BCRC 34301]
MVFGILIDYDYAKLADCKRSARPERMRMVPFMSVLNLEAHWSTRTELDDWELLLYVVCWLVTFGINRHDRQLIAKATKGLSKFKLKICGWAPGNLMEAIAIAKREQLHSLDSFIRYITDFLGKGLAKILNYSVETRGAP